MSALVAEFKVVGTPIPQGSMRAFNRRGGGRPIVTADNARTRPWKDAVAWAARNAVDAELGEGETCRVAVDVVIEFRLARPKGHHGARGLLPSAPTYPAVKPDLDKLTRAVLDALVDAAVIADDAQVVQVRATKEYGDPGAWVRVERAA
jgi:Holliday junction resolvase RusA-like endonuclease